MTDTFGQVVRDNLEPVDDLDSNRAVLRPRGAPRKRPVGTPQSTRSRACPCAGLEWERRTEGRLRPPQVAPRSKLKQTRAVTRPDDPSGTGSHARMAEKTVSGLPRVSTVSQDQVLSCQGTVGCPRGRTGDLPVGGQFISLSAVS